MRSRIVLAAALLAAAAAAFAQAPSGRRGSGMPPRSQEGAASVRPAPAPEPVYAIEHELPSLKVDLRLTPEQVGPWESFARAVRDVAELGRMRTRKLMAPPPVDVPAPAAPQVLASLADDDRRRSEAMTDASARLQALYEILTPAQRSLLDRRILLAQTEPLGTR